MPNGVAGFKIAVFRPDASGDAKGCDEAIIIESPERFECAACTVNAVAGGGFAITAEVDYSCREQKKVKGASGARVHVHGKASRAGFLMDSIGGDRGPLRRCLEVIREVVSPGGAYRDEVDRCFPGTTRAKNWASFAAAALGEFAGAAKDNEATYPEPYRSTLGSVFLGPRGRRPVR